MGKFLSFTLNGKLYGVNVLLINSILENQTEVPIPIKNSSVRSLTNMRGIVVPIFDPRALLDSANLEMNNFNISADVKPVDQTKTEAQENTKAPTEIIGYDNMQDDTGIIVFEVENGTLLPFIALKADTIGKVISIDEKDIKEVPAFLPKSVSKFYEGFTFAFQKRLSILNIKALVSNELLFNQEA